MKKYITLSVLFAFLYACTSVNKGISNNKKVKIFKELHKENYTLLYGVKDKDTIAYIVETNLISKCKKHIKYIFHDERLKQVSSIKTDTDTIYFSHTLSDTNNRIKIQVGEKKPKENLENYVYTYSKYPYHIQTCENLR